MGRIRAGVLACGVLAGVIACSGEARAQSPGFPGWPPVAIATDAALERPPSLAPSTGLTGDFGLAREAIARGDYDTAIALLERLLRREPDLPRVRLELGLLYYKTGAYARAKRLLDEVIAGGALPLDVQARAKLYLADIARREAPFQYYLFLQAGARYQTNANIGPDSTLIRALGHNLLLPGQFAQAPNWNAFQTAAFEGAWKLTPRGDAIETTLVGYASEQNKFRQFDLDLIEATLGPRIYLNRALSLKLYGIGDAVWFREAPYFQAAGAGGTVRASFSDRAFVETYVEWRHRQFYDSASFPNERQQTGDLLTAALYGEIRFGQLRWATRLAFDDNRAEAAFNSYRRWSLDLRVPTTFVLTVGGESRFLILTPTAGVSTTTYEAADPLVDPRITRLDHDIHVGGIADLQLYQALGLRLQIMQSWVHSSLPNYGQKNFSVSFGPTARF